MTDPVLIIGGGIAGLALARALHRHDIAFTLHERREHAADAGLAVNLPGNAITALHRTGLGEEIAAAAYPVLRREYRTATGRLLFQVDERAFWGADAQPRCARRADLHRMLRAGLPEGTVHEGAGVTAVRQDAGGAEIDLDDGSTVRGSLVVGADGVRSTVRRAAFGDDGIRAALLSAASFRFMAPNPGVDCWAAWAGTHGNVLLIPVSDDEVYGFATAARGGPTAPDPAWLAETFAGFPEPVRQTVKAVTADPAALYHSPIEEVRVTRWAQGRAVLIGDAAHATAPIWAQGAALALEDAEVLAGLLAAGAGPVAAAAEFERVRRLRVTHVQTQTDRFSRTAALPGWLRAVTAPLAGKASYRAAYGPLREWPGTPGR
ncbi:FAD-dependent monooxygenase [Nucisporomicrobium flavum]|uniref:FAD-dependent monooxygenase n=1 Tax=Nucisporomicrobium flavum TaxID=2785915 RepID=UPI0018F7412B|nr:FAD-dependent monooxygenase [Nucisporomicrobium flavum]